MKKTTVLLLTFLAVVMFAGVLAPALASADETGTWTGWITDDSCGAKGAKAEHKACALKCANGGGKLVFYETGNHKIYKIADQEQAKRYLGSEVVITGEVLDGTFLRVDSIDKTGK
jgi:hypothetical protein